jgi:hypothetical protein
MKKLHRPAWGVVAIVAGVLGLITAQASARAPIVGSFPIDDTFIDDGASAACGFPVTATDQGTGHFQLFFDSHGNPSYVDVEEHVTGNFTANGLTVPTASDNMKRYNLVNGADTEQGIEIRVSLPHGGILYIDRGRLVFDGNGNLVSEAGPHPSLHGDFPGLCAALTP